MVFLHIIYVIVCLVLSISILLQSSKGGGLGAGLGGGGSATTQVFGGRGAGGFLAKTTVACAAIYMSMSLLLSWLSSKPQSELDLSNSSEVTAAAGDPIIEEGALEVNPDGSPLGSEPAKTDGTETDGTETDATKTDATKTEGGSDKPPIEIKVNEDTIPIPGATNGAGATPPADEPPAETPPADDAAGEGAPE